MEEIHSDKNTVLLWLDNGPYAYIHFAIAHALSKISNSEFVGIVTNKQDVSFFENQKYLKFKKLFYYPECYQEKSSYDSEKLKEFEKKYELDLWLDIFSDRFFHKYRSDFHVFTPDEILTIIENSLHFFINILEEFHPKLILMQTAGENVANLLFYRLAKKLEFNILMTNIVHLHNRIAISDNLITREISEEFQKILSSNQNISKEYDENFIKKESLAETVRIQSSFSFDNSTLSQKIKHFAKRLSNDPESIYQNFGKTKSKMFKARYENHFKIKKREQFLNENSLKSIGNEKFLYFPLHTEPEAKILATAPFFSDQISLIENIARSMPIDYFLCVKEHPTQKSKSWRSILDYQRILAIPNVKFFHPSVNSQDLISKSSGVIAISGSTAFETLFFKKPVFLLAEDYYDVVSMVTKISEISKLPKLIKTSLNNFKFKNDELNAIIQATENISISVNYFSIMKDGIYLSSIQRNTNDSNVTLKHFEKFFKNYENDFNLFAKTISDKI